MIPRIEQTTTPLEEVLTILNTHKYYYCNATEKIDNKKWDIYVNSQNPNNIAVIRHTQHFFVATKEETYRSVKDFVTGILLQQDNEVRYSNQIYKSLALYAGAVNCTTHIIAKIIHSIPKITSNDPLTQLVNSYLDYSPSTFFEPSIENILFTLGSCTIGGYVGYRTKLKKKKIQSQQRFIDRRRFFSGETALDYIKIGNSN